MSEEPTDRVTRVLIPIVIQDLSVLAAEGWDAASVHPSGARCASGFLDGPVCRRVAVVDIDASTGTLRPPARVVNPAEESVYRGIGGYDVQAPSAGDRREPWLPWLPIARRQSELNQLEQVDYVDDPFMKVSAFGTLVRTICFFECAVGLARRTAWAFDSPQLLLVPAAGELGNAFYHRGSGSLQFYYFDTAGENSKRVYTALSQDVVVHESAHALIDAAAPDLHDPLTPDCLAIHEGLADIVAALLSMLNREFRPRRPAWAGTREDRTERFMQELSGSSRYSRFAEQFGERARGAEALRELINNRRLGDDASDPDVVDVASPHSLSEVLSGALFGVLRRSVVDVDQFGPQPPFRSKDSATRSGLAVATAGRIASLALKGLDWLPPGDVSLADYGRAALVADRFHLPDLGGQRDLFVAELARRGVARAGDLDTEAGLPPLGPIDFGKLHSNRKAARAFVCKHRDLFGIPEDVPFERPIVRLHRTRHREIRGWARSDTVLDLDSPVAPITPEDAELLVIQVAWWKSEPNCLAPAFGLTREVKCGATLAVGADGAVHALLRGGQEPDLVHRRDAFLRRQARHGNLLPPHQGVGPDGEKLAHFLYAETHPGGMRVSGGLRALDLLE